MSPGGWGAASEPGSDPGALGAAMPTTLDELGISSGGSWRSPSSSTTASPVATRIPLVKALCAPKARVCEITDT